MYFFKRYKSRLLFIIVFLFMWQTLLFASHSYLKIDSSSTQGYTGELINETKVKTKITSTQTSLDFGVGSMGVLLILTSLLGLFFMRDELTVL